MAFDRKDSGESTPVEQQHQHEKRKSTPPDLLELSNMYFDRQQRIMATDSIGGGGGGRLSESSHSYRMHAR